MTLSKIIFYLLQDGCICIRYFCICAYGNPEGCSFKFLQILAKPSALGQFVCQISMPDHVASC